MHGERGAEPLDEDKELNPNGAYSGARDEEAALASGVQSVQATRYKTINI
jgi:hypothetical protein